MKDLIETKHDLSEDGAAQLFTKLFRSNRRYDHDVGRWFIWTGSNWQAEGTGRVLDDIREIVRTMALNEGPTAQTKLCRSTFMKGAEQLARVDRAHAVQQDAWDNDTFLLGCPGQTIDLRTGQAKAPDPSDGITKQAAVAPSDTGCPRWLQFLDEATGGDKEVIEFLRRWCGYCLTGDTREHALIFLFGPGKNGKSVFLNTIAGILGDYSKTAPMDSFMASSSDKHPTDMAMLRGARLVSASETEEGRSWAEAKIKQLTGGDKISARFMHKDFFTFLPQFKLTIVGNHAPILANVDEAARRRFNIVPFVVKPAKPDKELEAKLKTEWPGILHWMIGGCVAWQESGLAKPPSVAAATDDYFDEQDLTGQWLSDACELRPGDGYSHETAAELFASWSAYAKAAGEEVGTAKGLANRLKRHGLRQERKKVSGKTLRLWTGVRITRDAKGIDHG